VSVSTFPTALCFDRARWSALLAHRLDRANDDEPVETGAALDHAATCPRCAALALELDPSLLFVRLRGGAAAQQVPAIAEDTDADVVAMRQAVASLRRAARVEAPGRRAAGGAFGSRRFASAAALAALVGTLAWGFGAADEAAETESARSAQALASPLVTSGTGTVSFVSFADRGATVAEELDDWRLSPVVEPLDRADARIYKLDEERDLSVTLIVDASFDV
jgi:hypothetical protein